MKPTNLVTRRIAIGTIAIAVVMLVVGLMGVAYVNRLLQTQAQDELFRQAEATGRLVEGAHLRTWDATLGPASKGKLRDSPERGRSCSRSGPGCWVATKLWRPMLGHAQSVVPPVARDKISCRSSRPTSKSARR